MLSDNELRLRKSHFFWHCAIDDLINCTVWLLCLYSFDKQVMISIVRLSALVIILHIVKVNSISTDSFNCRISSIWILVECRTNEIWSLWSMTNLFRRIQCASQSLSQFAQPNFSSCIFIKCTVNCLFPVDIDSV